MPDFSSRTVGVLAQLLDRGFTQSELDNLFVRHDLKDAPYRSGRRPTKLERATVALSTALKHGDQGALKAIIEEMVERRSTDAPDKLIESLKDGLRSDGWTLDAVEYEPPERSLWDSRVYTHYELNVLGSGAVPLVDDTTALERQLIALGLTIAAGHYKQAVDGNAERKWASANSQLRAAFESVLVGVATKLNPAASAMNGGGSINAIDKTGAFAKGERNYIDGLWTLAHSNGSHPGLSDEEESTNRLSAVTAAMSYILRRFM